MPRRARGRLRRFSGNRVRGSLPMPLCACGKGSTTRATRDAVQQRLAEMIRAIRENDVVLLYFAGHGVVPSGQEMFYFVPVDSRATDLRRTGVSTAVLADDIRGLDARRVVLFIDACQSGGAVEPL